MEVSTSTAPSCHVDASGDGSRKPCPTAETGAALETAMSFASPPAMAETRSPASTVSHDNMDDFQTPTAMTGAVLISASSTTQHASSKDTASSGSSHLHDPPGEFNTPKVLPKRLSH